MKKVKTNAQVTSIVCIMEAAILFINWILLSQLVFWISIFVLYLIILPYFRLVNTSHNKDRVVEYGWKNVLGNLFGNKWRLITSCCNGRIQKNNVSEICILNETDHNYKDNLELNVISTSRLSDIPCTSKGNYVTKQFYSPPTTSDTSSTDTIECSSIDKTKQIISEMFRNIYNEKEYTRHLRSLVMHLSNKKYSFHDSQLTNDFLPNSIPDVYRQRRLVKGKGKKSFNNKMHSNQSPNVETILNVNQLQRSIIPDHFIARKIHRTNIRDTLLQEIQSNFGNKEKLDILIEQLIHEEENFLN